MNIMNYIGNFARVDFDAKDGLLVGFHADNVAGLAAAFDEAVGDYLETCKKAKKGGIRSSLALDDPVSVTT